MSDSDVALLLYIGIGITGILFGHWQTNNLWVSTSTKPMRKECRGILYYVIREGDKEMLIDVCESERVTAQEQSDES